MKNTNTLKATLALSAALCLGMTSIPGAWADSRDAAQAGVVERTLDRETLSPKKEAAPPVEVASEKEARVMTDSGQKIRVEKFVFQGNASIPSSDLQKITNVYLSKELSFLDLQEAAAKIKNEYRARGYFLAQVYLPEQEIREGAVVVDVVEGRLGKIIVRGQKRFSQDWVLSHFQRLEKKSALLYKDLLRALLLLNEYPNLVARSTFAKGEKPGTTDLIVDVEEKTPYSVYGSYDNGGSEFVSESRYVTRGEWNYLLLPGDKIYAAGALGSPARNLKYGSVGYSLPLTANGTWAEFSYTRSEFKGSHELRLLDVRGDTDSYRGEVRHALVRTREWVSDVSAALAYKQLRNYLLNEKTSDDELRVVELGWSNTVVDGWQGKTYLDNTLSIGIPDWLGGSKKVDPLSSRVGAGGQFVKYDFNIYRIQKLFWNWFLILKAQGQAASGPLPSAEQMILGGIDSVRGFAQAEHLGDEGYFTSAEIRVPVPAVHPVLQDRLQLAGFVDHGGVLLLEPQPGEREDSTITGAGVGLRIYLPNSITVSLDWAFPIGGNERSDRGDSVFYIKVNGRFP